MRTLVLLLFLAGCGSGGDESVQSDATNHGYGFTYDVQGVSGLKLRYSGLPSVDPALEDPKHYEDVFERVRACTGRQVPMPPFVILTDFGQLGPQILGLYYSNPSLILIQKDAPSVLGHEMIHYILQVTTGDLDANHSSPLFNLCQTS